jgi:TolA-binding protein
MGQGPPPVRRQPDRRAAGGGVGIVISSVLALLFGGAGAWAYERFLSPWASATPSAAPNSRGRDAEARKDLTGLENRIKDLTTECNNLADQYKKLQSRVELMPRSARAPDLAPIEQKVAQVDRLSQQLDAIGKKIDPLPQKLEQSERRITELDQKLDELRKQETAARGRRPSDRDRQVPLTGGDHPSPSTGLERPSPAEAAENKPSPSDDKGQSVDPTLESGVSLFREKRYGEAYAVFRKLLQSQPDDARVWYYAALAYGLSTGDWSPMTQTMVEEGVAREKAGKPAKAEIDSAFAGLTKETGKDWLAFYRRRAR